MLWFYKGVLPGFFLAGQQRWLQEVTAPGQEIVKHITPPSPWDNSKWLRFNVF